MADAAARAADPGEFVLHNTHCVSPPLVPEVTLRLATEVAPIWQMSEEALSASGLPPPYWAFAWAGGQALARHVLDHPDLVQGRRVLDFGSGSGLVAIAAVKAGAAHVTASDTDPFARAAISINAHLNGVRVTPTEVDLVGQAIPGFDVILAADICYEQPLAGEVTDWLGGVAQGGRTVLIGDPGRTYLPRNRLDRLASYAVETTRELEDSDLRHTGVWVFRT